MFFFARTFAALFLVAGAALGAADGSVSGQLTDLQGRPVSGASVTAESPGAGIREIRSDSEGRFSFPSLPPGAYNLVGSAPSFAGASQMIAVTSGPALTVNLQFVQMAPRTEAITVTADRVATVDVESPVAAVKVLSSEDLLDANPGHPGAPVFLPGYPVETASSVQTLSAQEDDTRAVSGTVVNEKSEVVVGATVSAQSPHAQRTATTDNQGNFLLRMPVEAMTLTVSGPSIANFQETLAASAPSQGLRLQIHYLIATPPQLSGTVVDTSGGVIAGATVQVLGANGTVQITTQSDANGSFIISGLSAGDYRFVVSNPGFETKEIPVTIGTTEAPARCASPWLWAP